MSLNLGHDPGPDEGRGRFSGIRQAGPGAIRDSAGRRYATRATTPSITGLAITSDPGSDDRYVSGDKIEVAVTFSEAVTVTGSPRLTLLLGSPFWIQLGRAARNADFARQSEPGTLVFAYTVTADDNDPDGVSVAADSLSLNGGTIIGGDGAAARRTHDALAAQPRHLVDTIAPTVLDIFVDGATLSIGYSEALDTSSVPGASRFRVRVGNALRSVSDVSVANRAVTLTLATAVLPGEEADVSYSAQTDPIRDLAGHSAAGFAFSALEVVNETRPTVSIAAADDAVYEGTDVEFSLTRNGPVIASLIVDVEVVDRGSFLEFETNTQTLEVTFEAGNSTALLTLSTLSDLDYEAHAELTATVRPSSLYAVSTTDGSATVMISDNDAPETAVALEVPANVAETSGTLTVRVRATTIRDEVPHGAVSIILASADGTAVAGEDGDFTAIDTVIRFAAGDFERVEVEGEQRHVHVATVEKKIDIHDDAVAERDETFTLHLRQPAGVPRMIRLPDSPTEVSIVDNEAPGRTANVAAEPGDGMVTVSWSEVASATGYKVQWKSGTTETFDTAPVDNRQQIVSGGATTSAAIGGLTNGTAYTLQVIAFNSGGDGPASPEAMATPQMPPSRVTGVTLTEGDGRLTVSWRPVTHATGYKVQWKAGTTESFDTAVADGREHTVSGTLDPRYVIGNLENCTPYTVRVVPTNHGVDGPASAEAIGTPTFEPERARPGTTLVSNTGYDVDGAFNLRLTLAGGYTQEFTTGSNTGDFLLESVGVRIGRVFPGPVAAFTAYIYRANDRGGLGAWLYQLAAPDRFACNRVNLFKAPAGATLQAETRHLLLFPAHLSGTTDIWASVTSSDAEDGVMGDGWSIDDVVKLNGSPRAGGPLMIDVNGRSMRNVAPTASDRAVTTAEDTAHAFAATEFGFMDEDTADELASVKITELPGAGKGTLTVDGTAIDPADLPNTVTKAELDAGMLVYAPPGNANGTGFATFKFRVGDDVDESVEYTMTVNVTAVNDSATGAPEIAGTAWAGEPLTASTGTVDDPDGLPQNDSDYAWQWLRVDGATETEIEGATETSYTPTDADVGKTLKVRLRFTDPEGGAEERFSAPTARVAVDNIAPTVTSIMRQTPLSSPTNANSLTWRVTFSEEVGNVDRADFTVSNTTATLTAAAVTGSSLAYDVTASGGDLGSLNATVTLTFATGRNITDPAGNALANTTPTDTNEASYVVDHTAPTVTSIMRQSPASSPTHANSLTWRVTFSEAVANVDSADFMVTGTTSTLTATPVTTETGAYDVTAEGGNLAGLDATTVTLSFAAAQNIADMAGNELTTTAPTGANENTFEMDNTAPTVASIVRQSPTASPTHADVLTWRVTFSEAVENVDSADFTVTGTTATLTVTQVTTETGAYDVTAEGGNLAGLDATTVTLSFAAAQNIADMAGNELTTTAPTGANENTFEMDNTAPTVASIVRQSPTASPTHADVLTWRVTFSEAVENVDSADFTVTGTTATLTVTPVAPGTGAYDVTAEGGNLAGLDATTVTLSFAAAQNIADMAGNELTTTAPTGANENTFEMDNTAPTVTISGVPTMSSAAFTATITFSEPVTGFVVADIALNNATASTFTGADGDMVFTALITPTANGAVTVDVAADVAADAAGNGNTAAAQVSSTYTAPLIDNIAPRVASIMRQNPTASPTHADSLTWRVTFSEAVENVDAADFTVTGTTATLTVTQVTTETGAYDVTAEGGNLAGLGATTVTLSFAAAQNIADMAGHELTTTAPTGANENTFEMDNTAPTVTISGVPTMSSAAFTATITFSEPVTGFVVADIALNNATASTFTGADGDMVFTALITPTANGAVTVDVAADVAADAAGNGNTAAAQVSSTYTAPLIDNIAPRVASIMRQSPTASPTHADSLTWRVTFSEAVANVDSADFTVTGTTATLTVTQVTTETGAYDVTASGGNLAGLGATTVTLSFAAAQNIADMAGNELTTTAPTGANENTFEMDNTAPTVTISGVPTMSSAAFTATITFSEPVTGFVMADIALNNATASTFTGTDGDMVFTALITPTANGAVTVDVAADVAADAAGNGNTAAAQVSSTYTTTVPGAPSGLTATASGTTQINLSWSAPASNGGSAITGYKIEVSSDGGTNWTNLVANTGTTNTTYAHTGLTAGSTRHYRVSAINTNGTGAPSNTAHATTDANAAPLFSSPAAFTAAENQTAAGTVQASDADSVDVVTGYAVVRGADASKFTIVAATGVLTFASVPNFEAPGDADGDNAYVVVVRATSGAGARVKTADQTITVTVTDMGDEAPGVPAAPMVSSAGVSSVTASWTAPTNAGPPITDYDYRHRVKTPPGSWTEVTNTTITVLSATITMLAENMEYEVQVRATNDEGTGGWSESGSGSTPVENIAPTVMSITIAPMPPEASEEHGPPRYSYTKDAFLALPDGAVHGRGATLTFPLTFDTAVTVTPDSDTRARPELVLDIFGRERRAHYTGPVGTPTDTMVFSWTVMKGDNDPDGLEVRRIALNGATIRDSQDRDTAPETFPAAHHEAHRVRGGLHAMWFVVSGSAREGLPFTVKMERSGGFEEPGHALVRVTDSGMPDLAPNDMPEDATAEYDGLRLMSFPFDAVSKQGADTRYSERTVTPPGDGVADGARTLKLELILPDVGDGEEGGASYWYEMGDPVEVTVRVTDTGLAKDTPTLSVRDAWTREPTPEQAARGTEFPLRFDVVLRPAGAGTVTVGYRTEAGTASAGADYVATSDTLTFAPGETLKTVEVGVLADSHDEGSETMKLVLSRATGAAIADAEGTGTIRNSGPIPKAWNARFGRTVAEQVLEAVEGRMRARREPGAEVKLAGERVGGEPLDRGPGQVELGRDAERQARREEEARRDKQRLADWLKGDTDPEEAQRRRFRAVTSRDLLTGSAFTLTAETAGKGVVSLWGRGAVTRFDGREGELSLDGEVVSGMLGADWSRERWTAGLIVSHSRGEGGYSDRSGSGEASSAGSGPGSGSGTGGRVEATLTGLLPWARHALSERLEAWGAAGYGAGELTVMPKKPGTDEDGAAIRADLDLRMAAAGLRGRMLDGGDDGLTLTGKTDAMVVQTASGRGRGRGGGGNLEPARATVTRLRLGLEAGRPVGLGGGAALRPSLEVGLRHDSGDAETGFGLDLSGGLALSDPKRGLQAELRGRGLLAHRSKGFRDLGFSGSLAWEEEPSSDRGAKLRLTQTVGGSSSDGADSLLSRGTLEGLAANDNGAGGDDDLKSRRLELKLGYGLSAFGDRFTWTPEAGVGLSDTGRDNSLGWRLVRRGAGGGGNDGSLELSFEARRRESANDDTPPAHEVGLRLTARF